MQQKKFYLFFFPQEAGASRDNIGKELEKPHLTSKKTIYDIFTENICFACN